MTINHARVNGNLNEFPDKLGGEDWDDPHVVHGPECVAFVKVFANGATQSANKWPADIDVYWYPVGAYQVNVPGLNFQDASALIGAQYIPEITLYGRSDQGAFAEVAPYYNPSFPHILSITTYNGSFVEAEEFEFFILKVWKINP